MEIDNIWSKAHLIDVPSNQNALGSLGVIEGENPFPKQIKRVYFLYDIPSRAVRGSHAHKELHQFIIAMSGSFDINLDDGKAVETFTLSTPDQGLYIPPGYWRTLTNFSSGAAAVVLASEEYDESDYIREYEEFLNWKM